jgi:BTB/POZ domain
LNEELLCDRIPFFKGAFKSGWKEGKSKVMELPDDDPEAFGLLVNWIYTERVDCKLCDIAGNKGYDQYSPVHDLQWLKLWVLADKLNLTDVAEKTLGTHSRCLDQCRKEVSAEAVTYLCDHAGEESLLRKYMVQRVLKPLFLWEDRESGNIGDMGEVAATNSSFNREVWEACRDHLKLLQESDCGIYDGWGKCLVHDSSRRGQPDQFRPW